MAAVREFCLPFSPADLLRDCGPGRYVVQEVLPARELPPALTGKAPPPHTHTHIYTPHGLARFYRRLTAVIASPRSSPCFPAAFRTAFRARGALAVLQHFDPLYSLLQ